VRHLCRYSIALIAPIALTALTISTAAAQSAVDPNVRAEDVPMQPLRDLNIEQKDIPPLLIDIANDPYSSEGLVSCADIEQAIADIDALVGPDVDDPQERSDLQKGVNSAGRIAGSLVGGLIPFRGLIREISGAKGAERRLRLLVNAANVRRGFLKGIGLERNCPWPAQPGVDVSNAASDIAPTVIEDAAAEDTDSPAESASPNAPKTFVSRPVVQNVD